MKSHGLPPFLFHLVLSVHEGLDYAQDLKPLRSTALAYFAAARSAPPNRRLTFARYIRELSQYPDRSDRAPEVEVEEWSRWTAEA